jgi:hypothetical protein
MNGYAWLKGRTYSTLREPWIDLHEATDLKKLHRIAERMTRSLLRRIAEPVEVVHSDTRYREIAFLRTVTADTEPARIPRFAGYMIRYLEAGCDGSIHERYNPHPEIFGFDQPLEFDYVATCYAERWKLAIPSTLLDVPENAWPWAHHQVQQWLSVKARLLMERLFRPTMINRHFSRLIGLNRRVVHQSRLICTQRSHANVWGYESASSSFEWLCSVQKDAPNLVWLAWYLEDCPELNAEIEPVAQLRDWFRQRGVGPKGWRMFIEVDRFYWGTLQMYGYFIKEVFLDVIVDWIRRHERLGLPRLSPLDLGMKIVSALEDSGQGHPRSDVVANMSDTFFSLLARHALRLVAQNDSVEQWVGENWTDIEQWLLDHPDVDLDSNQIKTGWPWLKRRIDEWAWAVEQGKVRSRLRWEFSLNTYQRDQFEAVALHTNKALWEEGRRMCHCVGQLGHLADRGDIRFFSIREAGTLKSRATLELRQSANDSTWHVGSCLGVQNSRPATEIADFALEVALRYSEAANLATLNAA